MDAPQHVHQRFADEVTPGLGMATASEDMDRVARAVEVPTEDEWQGGAKEIEHATRLAATRSLASAAEGSEGCGVALPDPQVCVLAHASRCRVLWGDDGHVACCLERQYDCHAGRWEPAEPAPKSGIVARRVV
jgi:hypothetical protein